MEKMIHAQGDELSSPIISQMKTNENMAQLVYRLSVQVFLRKSCPGWVTPWTECQVKFLFAICFLLLISQCGELIPDKAHAHLCIQRFGSFLFAHVSVHI